MIRRPLGHSGFEISVIGFGGWQIGGPGGDFAWKRQDDRVSITAIHAALDRGVNWIDTAPSYGSGHSETVVGRAVASLAEKPLIFTKCGCAWDDDGRQWFDLSPSSIRREIEASLGRLGVEVIDLYMVHWPTPDEQLEAAWQALEELRREGLVRAIGASNVSEAQLDRLRAVAPIAAIELGYSLLDRRIEHGLLSYAREHAIGVVTYSPLQSGLLSGTLTRARLDELPTDDWRRRDPQFQAPYVWEFLDFAECLREVALSNDASVAELAVAWVLRDPIVAGAIVGMSNADQVGRIVGAASLDVRRVLERIDACHAWSVTLPRPPDRFSPPDVPES